VLRKSVRICILLIVMVSSFLLVGCGGPSPTVFLHREYNFGFVERVAVVPFENISLAQGAAKRSTRFFIAELLAAEVFDVIEPGEVDRALGKIGILGNVSPTRDHIVALGGELGVQAIFLGSVNEVTSLRSGSSQDEFVSLAIRLVETETGQTIWSATGSKRGKGFWSSIFGGGGKSQSEVMRKCAHDLLETLID